MNTSEIRQLAQVNPDIISNSELLKQKSEISKRHFFASLVSLGLPLAAFVVTKKANATVLAAIIGYYVSKKVAVCSSFNTKTAIMDSKAVESFDNHFREGLHFNNISNSAPSSFSIEKSTAEIYHATRRSQYI